MTTRAHILDVICEILRDDVRCGLPVTPATDLRSDAQLDSVDLLTLAVELENRFEITLDDETDLDCVRVEALVDRILDRLGAREPLTSLASEALADE